MFLLLQTGLVILVHGLQRESDEAKERLRKQVVTLRVRLNVRHCLLTVHQRLFIPVQSQGALTQGHQNVLFQFGSHFHVFRRNAQLVLLLEEVISDEVTRQFVRFEGLLELAILHKLVPLAFKVLYVPELVPLSARHRRKHTFLQLNLFFETPRLRFCFCMLKFNASE